MIYENVKPGIFLKRPNRFIAQVEIEGKEETVHVKNTGRCKELLIPGAVVYLQEFDSETRKTKYDLIAVEKKMGEPAGESLLINMDSQAPNKVVKEWLLASAPSSVESLSGLETVRPEFTYGASRLDFYLERLHKTAPEGREKILMEVKGVTLEENGVAMFPDAPTERGVKHIYELCEALKEGYSAYIFFAIQMKGIRSFTPNIKTHAAFGEALRFAAKRGVHILAYDCLVWPDRLQIDRPVEIVL